MLHFSQSAYGSGVETATRFYLHPHSTCRKDCLQKRDCKAHPTPALEGFTQGAALPAPRGAPFSPGLPSTSAATPALPWVRKTATDSM